MLNFAEARETVLRKVAEAAGLPPAENIALRESAGRVLAQPARADRDYPPFDRATRDGYAVRAADLASIPCELTVIGEVRAGTAYGSNVAAGECVSIMTGAPVPAECDAVVMVEYTESAGSRVRILRAAGAGENVVSRGSESRAGSELLACGQRIGHAEIALLASIGCDPVSIYQRPRVAIVPTGDEIVEVRDSPLPFQIRNSNSYSLCAQVEQAGAVACPLGIARDDVDSLGRMIDAGLEHDLLLLSGGVSMGKYDLVEQVLRERGAEFFFDAVAIQPGRPLVFGRARERFFFGLPGNPLSTMVTFELFARPAIDRLSGVRPAPLLFPRARLATTVRHKPGLTRFLPAILEPRSDESAKSPTEPQVRLVEWHGSGDLASLARANCYLVVPADREELPAGEMVAVLLRT